MKTVINYNNWEDKLMMKKKFFKSISNLNILGILFIIALLTCTECSSIKETYKEKQEADVSSIEKQKEDVSSIEKQETVVSSIENNKTSIVKPELKFASPKFVYKYKSFAKARLFKNSLRIWKKYAPFMKVIKIKSSMDSKIQSSLFYDSGSDRKKPLLVVVHSWSSNYKQTGDIPYALFAKKNDWVLIHPDFRGINKRPQATCSELAVQDVLDAVNYVKKHSNIDPSRIYLTGFSGGAMMSLVLAGRYPDLWTAVVAWVPVFDLKNFYLYSKKISKRKKYVKHILASCKGKPVKGSSALKEYIKRSPVTYLENAKGKQVKIYIAGGLQDSYVPPSHALKAYNLLADDKDKIPPKYIKFIDKHRKLPKFPKDFNNKTKNPLFKHAGVKLLFRKRSNKVSVFIFNCGHNMIYNVGLDWLSRHKQIPPSFLKNDI